MSSFGLSQPICKYRFVVKFYDSLHSKEQIFQNLTHSILNLDYDLLDKTINITYQFDTEGNVQKELDKLIKLPQPVLRISMLDGSTTETLYSTILEIGQFNKCKVNLDYKSSDLAYYDVGGKIKNYILKHRDS